MSKGQVDKAGPRFSTIPSQWLAFSYRARGLRAPDGTEPPPLTQRSCANCQGLVKTPSH